MNRIVLPELGEGIEQATIACWHVKVGDSIIEGADIVEVVTDKASFNIPSPFTGVLKEILAIEGEDVKIGHTMAEVDV